MFQASLAGSLTKALCGGLEEDEKIIRQLAITIFCSRPFYMTFKFVNERKMIFFYIFLTFGLVVNGEL